MIEIKWSNDFFSRFRTQYWYFSLIYLRCFFYLGSPFSKFERYVSLLLIYMKVRFAGTKNRQRKKKLISNCTGTNFRGLVKLFITARCAAELFSVCRKMSQFSFAVFGELWFYTSKNLFLKCVKLSVISVRAIGKCIFVCSRHWWPFGTSKISTLTRSSIFVHWKKELRAVRLSEYVADNFESECLEHVVSLHRATDCTCVDQ